MKLSVDVLRNASFRRLLATRMFGMFALQSQAVIVGWQVYTLTHDPLMLGLVGLVEAVPAIICALFAGHLVDISRPHRIYMVCIGILALNSLLLLLFAGGIIPVEAGHTLRILFAGVFLSGIARSFIMPASFTLLSQIVQPPKIPAASAWLTSGFQFSAIGGPAVAGIVYGGYGSSTAWFMPVTFMSLAFVMISSIGAPHRHYRNNNKREPAVQSIKAGWRFILTNRTLLSIMALDMFAVLFGGAIAMLPAFADQVLHTGSEGLGLLRAAPAAGSIVTALYFALRPMQKVRGRTLLIVIAGFGISILGFGASTLFLPAALFLMLSGAFDSVSMVIRSTLMQLLTPDAMRGRVSAVNSMFIISSNEIGAFESGAAASLFGLVPSILIGGVATLAIVGITTVSSPSLRRLVVDADAKAV